MPLLSSLIPSSHLSLFRSGGPSSLLSSLFSRCCCWLWLLDLKVVHQDPTAVVRDSLHSRRLFLWFVVRFLVGAFSGASKFVVQFSPFPPSFACLQPSPLFPSFARLQPSQPLTFGSWELLMPETTTEGKRHKFFFTRSSSCAGDMDVERLKDLVEIWLWWFVDHPPFLLFLNLIICN